MVERWWEVDVLKGQQGNRFGFEKSRLGYLRCFNQCCRPTLRIIRYPLCIVCQLKTRYALKKIREIIKSIYRGKVTLSTALSLECPACKSQVTGKGQQHWQKGSFIFRVPCSMPHFWICVFVKISLAWALCYSMLCRTADSLHTLCRPYATILDMVVFHPGNSMSTTTQKIWKICDICRMTSYMYLIDL